MADEDPIINIDVPEAVDDDDDAEVEAEKKEVRSRKDRPTGSIHFGDTDFDVVEEYGDATWGEVCRSCCCHTPMEWAMIFVGVLIVCFFLYWFLFGLDLLGTGAKVMTGCAAGELFGDDTNPVAGVMVGILATVLLQSSSTTTSIIVSLVGSAISINQGIYMVMGANIGTSVTNTIVAIGQMGDGDQLERAFAGATVHDMFNFLSVIILFIVEVITGYLAALTGAMVKNVETQKGQKWEGPIKKIVSPITKKIIIANKKVTTAIAKNNTINCGSFYPIECENPANPTYNTCHTGLVGCDKTSNQCPGFFQVNANATDDKVSGGVCFFMGICILFICLFGLVAMLQKMLLGLSTRVVYKATDINGYLAMLIGAGITVLVQSSSITTSTLTPLVGMGILRLEQMFPLTLGANIGTTATAIMAAMVTEGTGALQVALAHLFFNISGIIIWYPVPFMRKVPLFLARQLGKATRIWRFFPLLYIAVAFFAMPILFLALSLCFTQGKVGLTALGAFLSALIGIFFIWLFYWCQFKDGRRKVKDCFARRERRRLMNRDLPDDMDYLKSKVNALIEHTGLPADEDEDEEEDGDELEGLVEAAPDGKPEKEQDDEDEEVEA